MYIFLGIKRNIPVPTKASINEILLKTPEYKVTITKIMLNDKAVKSFPDSLNIPATKPQAP